MATITFNFTAAQSNRIQQATIKYNTANGTALTPKQWVLLVIRDQVIGDLLGDEVTAAQANVEATINADLSGTA